MCASRHSDKVGFENLGFLRISFVALSTMWLAHILGLWDGPWEGLWDGPWEGLEDCPWEGLEEGPWEGR